MGIIDIIIIAIGGFVCWVIGVLGGAQIFGSIEYRKVRALGPTLFTILLWVAIITASVFVILNWFDRYRIIFFVVMGIGMLMSFRHQEA